MKQLGAYRIAAILLIAVTLTLLATCGGWKAPQLKWQPIVSPQNEQPSESDGTGLPSVLELDNLLGNVSKGVRQGDQVVSYGADYDAGLSDTTSDREEAIEVEDTSLDLRAYEVGDYTYAIIPQLTGDGGWGGGRDDDVPLQSLIETEPCDYGGGRDDDVPLLYYIGFADYTFGSWRWYGPFTTTNPEVILNSDDLEDRFKSPTDMLYLAVLTTAAGKETSQLPRDGQVAPLPFDPAERAVSQLEDPVGVRVNLVTTDTDSGIGTLPQIVTGLEASVGASSITLTWDANPDPAVTMHQVFRGNLSTGGPPESLGEVPMPTLEYEDTTAVVDTTYRYSVRAVNDTGNGGFGEIEVGPPIIKAVGPLSGVSGYAVTFGVTLDGSQPFTYEWDFGGGALPNTSTDARPSVTLGEVGEYAAWVSIDNAYGHDSLDFVLTVREAPSWRVMTIVSEGYAGPYSSIAEVNGSPAIAYYDDTDGDLEYIRALDAYGDSWGTPVTLDSEGDVGWFISLAMVNGHPAVSYYDVTNDDLKYVRAADANGSSWGTPQVLDSEGFEGEYSSLAVVNGFPAISYYDWTYQDLKYIRAADANGDSWSTPLAIDTEGDVGRYTSLRVVNGYPAVSYFDNTATGLKYVRAANADGSSWGIPVALDSEGFIGRYTSLVVAAGNPAISYYDLTNGDLKFVWAIDAVGGSWGTPLVLDSSGDVGYYTSMALVGGHPAVSYQDGTNGDLKYIRAASADGSSWEAPLTLDSAGQVGYYTSLGEVNGCPAVSYQDNTSFDLKFAILY
jgi:hypothetical protein